MEALLLELDESTDDLDILRSAEDWAHQQYLGELWERVLPQAKAKLVQQLRERTQALDRELQELVKNGGEDTS